jgi:AcrR family transcriptional regulator
MTEEVLTTRQALLDCAAALFLDKGFDAVSMEQVRLQAAVSNGSLYHHFPSKAHLGRGVYLAALKDYQAHLMDAIEADTSAGDGVRALVRRHIAWVLSAPRQALVLDRLRTLAVIDGDAPDWDAVNAEAFSHLKSWIAVQVVRGNMLKLPFKVWLALVLGPSMQLTAGWALQEQPSVEPRVRGALADASWAAVRSRSTSKD